MSKSSKDLSKGLGSRYGFTVRRRYAELMYKRRYKYKCPRCELSILKRVSVGIWRCKKCGFTFAGGAYVPSTKVGEAAARSIVVEQR
ncbi:MAG: 50S ribosomal protein L37ae [Thermoproteota archaeon]